MIECLVYTKLRSVPLPKRDVESIVRHVLTAEKRDGSISIHLIGDTRMKRLQREHRGKETTTDVLSFPAEGRDPAFGRGELGDIFISIPQIRRQAREWGVSFVEEFTRMLTHGVLHILGYDHIKKSEAKRMFDVQEKYVAQFATLL